MIHRTWIVAALALVGFVHGAEAQAPTNTPFDSERWMTSYYEHPQPEKTFDAIRAIHDDGLLLLPNAQRPLIAFFSTIFRDNPSVTTQFLNRCSFLSEKEIGVLAYAFWFADTDESKAQLKALSDKDKNYAPFLKSTPPSILESEITMPNSLDMCWGHFFASGNTQYVGKVIQALENKNNKTDPAKILVYGSARWSLVSNCRQHKKVLAYCRTVVSHLPDTPKVEVQAILDEIDGKVVSPSVEKETADKLKQMKKANQTSDGIRQPADGSPKPSM
jgi:hypothetical protein